MIRREEIVREAREWIGTPYHHQGRVKGVGCDCAGLIIGIAHSLGISTFDYRHYSRQPDASVLLSLCDEYLDRVDSLDAALPGDVLIFLIRRQPIHMGILTEKGTVIHVWPSVGKVVEHILDEKWRRRIYRVYRYKEVI